MQKYSSVYGFFGRMILLKVGNNLAPGGIVDTLYLAISNLELSCAFFILKSMFIGNLWQFVFNTIPFLLLFIVL